MRGYATALALLFTTESAECRDEATVLIDMHVKLMSCASLAFLAGKYDKYEGMFRLASKNLDELLILRTAGDGTAVSWFEFNDYEIESRDYILGYDYGKASVHSGELVRVERDEANEPLNEATALRLYEREQCVKGERFFP